MSPLGTETSQEYKKNTMRYLIALAFGVFILVVSLCATCVFNPEQASLWAILALLISLGMRAIFPKTKNSFLKMLKMLGELVAVIFIFLTLHDISNLPILSAQILFPSALISILSGFILFRKL